MVVGLTWWVQVARLVRLSTECLIDNWSALALIDNRSAQALIDKRGALARLLDVVDGGPGRLPISGVPWAELVPEPAANRVDDRCAARRRNKARFLLLNG